jgi:hypothetical protein
MTPEQEIRAKALEIAVLSYGQEKVGFPPEENGGNNAFDPKLLFRARLIEQYIYGIKPD